MALFFDVSKWEEQRHYSTSGTRSKCVVQDPKTGENYFFKTSLIQQGKIYSTEFWSEIIAAEVGCWLGFNVLPYHIAKTKVKIGCISKSITSEKDRLIEGVALLKGYDKTYNPEDKTSYKKYTFEFVKQAITRFGLKRYLPDFIKMLVFDAIIGNSDRHQENWAFVETPSSIDFSPIYDSGSSLGRELSETSLIDKLKDPVQFNAYISRGKAELRCNKGKVNHLELLKYVHQQHLNEVIVPIQAMVNIYNAEHLQEIIFNIDHVLPDPLKHHGISSERKEFIFRLIDNRIQQIIKTFAL